MRTKEVLVVAAVALTSVLAGSAGADNSRFTDPNDTPGNLDVRAIRQSHDGSRSCFVPPS